MIKEFQQHLQNQFPYLLQNSFYIAVSGGIDSMVLVDLCEKLNLSFEILHCNFTLRNTESEAETSFLKAFASQKNIPIHIQYFDTQSYAINNKLSIQLAARALRYDWFKEQMKQNNIQYLLTAHHLNDSLETFIINLSRGTGLNGLIGIPQINENIVRPLLIFSREQIALYAQQNHLEWKEDSSNQSDKYLRNNIRHNIVPILEGLHTNFLESFHQTSLYLQQTQVLVQDALQKAYQDVVSNVNDHVLRFDLQLLMQLKPYTLYLHYWLKDFGFTAWEDIYNLAEAQTGKKIGSPTHTLLKNREELLLYPNDSAILEYIALEIDTIPYSNESIPIRIEFCNTSYPTISSANCIFVDYDKIKMPLVLRKWKEGDVFYPLGMQGKKKISKYFKDEKYSLLEKQNQWMLCSENQVVWLLGKRQDNRYKITNTTKTILKIQYK